VAVGLVPLRVLRFAAVSCIPLMFHATLFRRQLYSNYRKGGGAQSGEFLE